MPLHSEHDPVPETLDPAELSDDPDGQGGPGADDEITLEMLPPTIPEGVPSPLGDDDSASPKT